MSQPLVYLVGAGPGDKGLITIRGFELIKNADVIIYDQLGTSEFLSEAKADCEMYDVGKFAGNHKVSQDKINELLVEKARENKLVIRLKGGDPFIFGRGGEELLYLKQHGIAAEVVPGISSAIASPAYAGIPVTQRGYTSTLAFVTGHEAKKDCSDINWAALAQIGSLVFLMSVKNIALIANSLIEHGKPKTTPVAVIRNSTLPVQKTIVGSLADIADLVKKHAITPPAVTVVGDVVNLREELKWFEKRPLFGKNIVVTRSRMQASSLVTELKQLGANVIECPTIKIVQHGSTNEFKAFISEHASYEYLIFTSVNGVEGFIAALEAEDLDLRFLANKKIICIGSATAQRFIFRSIKPDFVPDSYVAESLIDWFKGKAQAKIAILRAEKAREILPQSLKKMGHGVSVVPIYRTEYEKPDVAEVLNLIKTGQIDLVTFTSSSTAEGFAKLFDESELLEYDFKAASIGPITSKTCKEFGLTLALEAKTYNIAGLVEEILNYFKENNQA